MFINIFGTWVNPDNITHLEKSSNDKEQITIIHTCGNPIYIEGKSTEQIAESINKQYLSYNGF